MYKRAMASPRVLHIVDPGVFADPGAGGPCTLRQAADLIASLPQFEHDVLVLGTREDALLAQTCGLGVHAAVCPPRLLPLGGRSAAKRSIGAIQRQRGTHDVVHGWTPRAAMYGSILLPHLPRVCSLHAGAVSGFSARALRMLLSRHQTRVIAANDAVTTQCHAAGLAAERMSVNVPGVDIKAAGAVDRVAVRERWGADDDTFVVGALCEPASASDARIAVRVISTLRLTGRKVAMVMHPAATRRADAKWWAKRVRKENLLIFDELAAQPWKIAAGLDAAWIIAAIEGSTVDPPSCLPMWWAMAAGLPVVVEDAAPAAQVIEEAASGLLAPPGVIPTILDRLTRLYDDRDWARRMGEAAQACAQQHAGIERYASDVAALYND